MESTLTSRGRVTIPKAVREHLGLEPCDRVKFFVRPDGTVVLLPKLPVTALRGIMKTRRRRTIEQMNEAIASQASEGVVRRRRG